MKIKFLKTSDPILMKIAKKIPVSEINSRKTKKIVETMLKVAYGEQKDNKKPILVGLAAPQIGISKRIILVDVKGDGKGKVGNLRVYINPEITWASNKIGEWYESCYSTGRVCGIVSRPTTIKIRALSLQPLRLHRRVEQIEKKYTGYVARIFQHEIDHLNGKVFVDLIKNPDHLHWVKKSEFPLYRNKGAWRNWPKKCSFEKWKKIKGKPEVSI